MPKKGKPAPDANRAGDTVDARYYGVVEVRFDATAPIPVDELAFALLAIDRIFQRQLKYQETDLNFKLAISRVSEGSQIYEFVPVILESALIGSYAIMTHSTALADFFERLNGGISGFISPRDRPLLPAPATALSDSDDIRAILEPLAGRRGAKLGLKKIHIRKRDGDREIEASVEFSGDDINEGAVNIDNFKKEQLSLGSPEVLEGISEKIFNEVAMVLEQANRGPGKLKGRTGDKGIIPSISPKAVSVYFRQSIQGLKELMVDSEENPFSMTYMFHPG